MVTCGVTCHGCGIISSAPFGSFRPICFPTLCWSTILSTYSLLIYPFILLAVHHHLLYLHPPTLHYLITNHPSNLINRYRHRTYCAASSVTMPPVVLESPVMNMHHPALSPISRLQFTSQMHTPPASDHEKHDTSSSSAPPSPNESFPPQQTSTQPLQVNGPNADPSPPIDPALRDQDKSSDNIDPALTSPKPPTPTPPPLTCANCGTSTTPLWRRDGDGKSICNACGELIFHYSIRTRLPCTRTHTRHPISNITSSLLHPRCTSITPLHVSHVHRVLALTISCLWARHLSQAFLTDKSLSTRVLREAHEEHPKSSTAVQRLPKTAVYESLRAPERCVEAVPPAACISSHCLPFFPPNLPSHH